MQPSNIWWILGLIFIIIGIVLLIIHIEKEKVTTNGTIQRVTLYGGIILLVLGVILVGVWIIKKFSGKKQVAPIPTNQNFNIGSPDGMGSPQMGYPQMGSPQMGSPQMGSPQMNSQMMPQPGVQVANYDRSVQMQGYPSQAMYGYGPQMNNGLQYNPNENYF
jgi:hypothetical protein